VRLRFRRHVSERREGKRRKGDTFRRLAMLFGCFATGLANDESVKYVLKTGRTTRFFWYIHIFDNPFEERKTGWYERNSRFKKYGRWYGNMIF
jgi:hypothetical protein